jgi:autotransporter-associated beta strand protein
MNRRSAVKLLSTVCLSSFIQQASEAGPTLSEVQSFTTSGNVSAAIYSSQYNLLLLRDSTTDIRVLNAATGAQLSLRAPSATGAFTDFGLSPSGRYLYVADYGGTNIGYNSPANPSYVDRYDLQTGLWTVAQAAGIGYHIAPVDDNRVLLLGVDQWVDLTLNNYAPGAMSQLSKISPGYSGNVKFGSNLNRIYYNETGISSTAIRAFNLSGTSMTSAESIAGGSYSYTAGVLSSDGSAFYYGQVERNAADLTKSIATFSEGITAANSTVAFGTAHYYDATSGTALGVVPYTPNFWTTDGSRSAWAIQQQSGGTTTLHQYVIAQSSLWNSSTGGSWSNTGRWNPTGLPDGNDNTADLSQVVLSADATLLLNGDHTVGRMVFGDLGATNNWSVGPGTGGSLTLAVTAGMPKITVANQTTTINVPISSTQGLSKDGAGTLILGSNSNYSGGTRIDNGTLQISSDSSLGAGPLAINGGIFRTTATMSSARSISLQNAASAIQVDNAFVYTAQAGATVSGIGGLTKLGTGTLDLTAATVNYSGPTTVNAGTLNVSSLNSTGQATVASGAALNVSAANLTLGTVVNSGNINFGNNSGVITLGALSGTGVTSFAAGASVPMLSGGTINVAGSANITTASGGIANLSGATALIGTLGNTVVNLSAGTTLSVMAGTQTGGGISGAGSLNKTSAGTLILGVDNTYGGSTTISAGTLQIGNGGTTGSTVGNVTDNGSLVFNRSDTYAFAGLISGTGSVTQNGLGTLILNNLNTYTGPTTVSRGTLQVGDGILPGTVSGSVINNGALIFNAPAAGQSIAGSITGTGTITKIGLGTTVLTGNNSNSGGTIISTGVLQIGDGGTSGSITGNIIDNAALVFNRSDNVALSGSISGSGRLEEAGGGTLALSGNISNALVASNGRIVVGPTSTFSGNVTTGALGRVENGGGVIHVTNLDNAGVLSGTADLSGSFLNRSTGDVRVAPGQRILIQSTSPSTNAGLVEVLGNAVNQAEFEAVGPFTNAAGGNSLIAARYASLRFNSGLTNHGSLSVNYGTSDVFGMINNGTNGTIAIAGGAGVTFYNDVTNNGSLVVSAVGGTRSSAVFLGTLTGSGGIRGGGDVFIMGDLRPGNSPSEVSYTANMYLGASSQTVMELGGLQSGTQADKVDVTGTLSLGGGLTVVSYNGFQPTLGDKFDLIDATTTTGAFSSISLPQLSTGLQWDTSALSTNGVISVVPEPTTLGLFAVAGLAAMRRRRKQLRVTDRMTQTPK